MLVDIDHVRMPLLRQIDTKGFSSLSIKGVVRRENGERDYTSLSIGLGSENLTGLQSSLRSCAASVLTNKIHKSLNSDKYLMYS